MIVRSADCICKQWLSVIISVPLGSISGGKVGAPGQPVRLPWDSRCPRTKSPRLCTSGAADRGSTDRGLCGAGGASPVVGFTCPHELFLVTVLQIVESPSLKLKAASFFRRLCEVRPSFLRFLVAMLAYLVTWHFAF